MIWGEFAATAATESDYQHQLEVTDFSQAPNVVAQLQSVTPSALLVETKTLDEINRRRFVDFLLGYNYAARGHIVRVGSTSFAITVTPANDDDVVAYAQQQLPLDHDRIESSG